MYKAVDVGGQFLATSLTQADGLSMFDSCFGMGHWLWVHLLLAFLLLGPQVIEAGKVRLQQP